MGAFASFISLMWKLLIVDDQAQKTVVNLVREEYSIGRAAGHPIRLTERNVSRHHATIRRTASGYQLEDHHSYNGIFVNGVRVIGRQDIGHGDLIQLGDYRAEVVDETLETAEQSHLPYPESPQSPASGRLPHRLVVLVGPDQGAEFPLEIERVLIGRGEECEIQLDHASVSRIHAEVRRMDDQHFELLDKGSANGLRINGQDRSRAVLDGRDVVELGDVVLKYIAQGQVFHAGIDEGRRIAILRGSSPVPAEAKPPLGPKATLFAALFGAVLVAGLLVLLVSRSGAGDHEETSAGARDALTDATTLYSSGDLAAAHELLSQVSPESPLAESPKFREIEGAWADAMLASAKAEADPAVQRTLLDAVSRTETAPADRRKRALDFLNELADGGMALDDFNGADPPPEEAKAHRQGTPVTE